jgi:hypothetical protein
MCIGRKVVRTESCIIDYRDRFCCQLTPSLFTGQSRKSSVFFCMRTRVGEMTCPDQQSLLHDGPGPTTQKLAPN